MNNKVNSCGRQVSGTNVPSRNNNRQRVGHQARNAHQRYRRTHSSNAHSKLQTTVHTFTVGARGKRVGKVSIGVGILAGAILLGLGIMFMAPPSIAIGSIILGFSVISVMITAIAQKNLELASDL